jgi:hypothetical protein
MMVVACRDVVMYPGYYVFDLSYLLACTWRAVRERAVRGRVGSCEWR